MLVLLSQSWLLNNFTYIKKHRDYISLNMLELLKFIKTTFLCQEEKI